MQGYQDQQLSLSKLKLDPTNPRHPEFESQREIIEWMTSGIGKIGEKLVVLAKDISEFGLNPADRVIVTADEKEKGQFVVLEGNRRLTALKLLNNPDMAPTLEWKHRFSKFRPRNYSSINSIPCVVFDDLEKAFHFIELRHQGESGGAGIVGWGSEQKARHNQRLHRRPRHHKALAVLDFIRDSDGISSELKDLASSGFPITTLDRILSDREFRNFLGLDLNSDGDICFTIEPNEAMKPIKKVIHDFGSGTKKVGSVINKEERDKYKNEFKKGEMADLTKVLTRSVRVIEADLGLTAKSQERSSGGRSYPDPRNRRYVIISGTNFPINPARSNRAKRVFEELKRVEIKDRQGKPRFPNAGILLLRLFLEISVDTYIKECNLQHSAPAGWRNISLTERTKAVLRDLESRSVLDPQEVRMIKKVLGDTYKVSNPNSLNDLAHNPNQITNPNDLIDVWDTYTRFLLSSWQTIKETE